MTIRKWMVGVAVGLVAVASLAAAAVGSASSKAAADYNVGLVTDIGGLNDKGFNSLAYKGLKQSQTKLGVKGRVFISKSAADYIPNLSTAARANQLVIAVGFLMADSVSAAAKRFPNTNFAIVDYPWVALKGKPKNVRGIIFAEQEAGCLAGVAAANVTNTNTISTVGGVKIPPVDAFIAGYRYCAKKVKPSIQLLNDYSQDFVAQDKCKELALKQNDAGSDVIFQVAGGCGLGALGAAKDRKVWGIGVDNDQGFLGSYVLTSATKKVDSGVFQTIALGKTGKFKGMTDGLFNVKNGGVGYGAVSSRAPKRAALIGKLELTERRIINGQLKPPRTFK